VTTKNHDTELRLIIEIVPAVVWSALTDGSVDGTLHLDSAPSRGTRIDAWVQSGMLTGDRNDAAPRSETA